MDTGALGSAPFCSSTVLPVSVVRLFLYLAERCLPRGWTAVCPGLTWAVFSFELLCVKPW